MQGRCRVSRNALKMEEKLKVGDLVLVLHEDKIITEGRIVNINEFRPPAEKFAVDIGLDDVVFLPEERLLKK
ncbi:hypothetical protein GCM10010965_14350 [Caldalkalibacillus thermarum]|uniref:hypothetical protein n=1 Tax=Caldalkalibacillus thermarum TaxID=296745 RepID=UPI001669BD3F|nr:hypothetical protein [Caldalkalibacillus thermarum]GGK22571.1 hypothetical protein GCM10010965_14350 [Caldalkalibacillus thermarum]